VRCSQRHAARSACRQVSPLLYLNLTHTISNTGNLSPLRSALLAIGAPCESNTSVQVENACLSLAVLQHLGVGSSWDGFFWPCRLERFSWKGSEVVLDGAHNGDSVHHFLRDLRALYPHKQILLLFGAGQDKCLSDMLEEVFEGVDSLVMVRSKHFRSLSERELLQQVPADKLHLVACQRTMSLSALEGGSIASWLDKVTDENASGYLRSHA
jgi:folylpolyglutamate synthase/dihydropteroate synthase